MGTGEEMCTFIATQDINHTNGTFVRKVIKMSLYCRDTLPVLYTN